MPTNLPQYAARKIKRAKWERAAGSADEALLDEAIRSDLTDETGILSFWTCDDSEQSVAEAILAMASAHVHLESTDVVWVPVADLTEAAGAIIPTPGQTPFTPMADRHLDVTADSFQITMIATLFLEAVKAGRCRRMTKRHLVSGIAQAIPDGFTNPDSLAPGIKRHLPTPQA